MGYFFAAPGTYVTTNSPQHRCRLMKELRLTVTFTKETDELAYRPLKKHGLRKFFPRNHKLLA